MIKATLLGIALAILMALSAGCASNSSMSCCSSDDKSDASSSAAKMLMKADQDWSNTVATHDVDKVVSYYTADAVVFPPNEPMVSDHASVRKVWAAYVNDPSFKLSWNATSASVDGGLGYTSGTYVMSMNGPDGKPMNENGKFLCVWQKQSDGTWKSIRDMWNSDSK